MNSHEIDYNIEPEAYSFQRKPDRIIKSKGMNNHFVCDKSF